MTRKRDVIKVMLLLMLFIGSNDVFAVTSGPTQPEVQQFTPIGASDMVDLFSGNFMYNIPLFELPGPNGGYPFNIGYRSGITMDQEASWVGLGWNLHVGSINRQMRTLPDEFNGTEQIIKRNDQLDNKTIGVGIAYDVELGGFTKNDVVKLAPSYGVSMYFNSYKGVGFTTDIGIGATFGGNKSPMNGGLGITVTNDNQEGATVSPYLSLSASFQGDRAGVGGSLNLGLNYNSNMGLQNISLGGGMSVSSTSATRDAKVKNKRDKGSSDAGGSSFGVSQTASMSFNNAFITSPSIKNSSKVSTFQGFFKIGGYAWGVQMSGAIHGNYSNEVLIDKMKPIPYPAYGYFNLQKGENDDQAALDFIREKEGSLHKEIRNLAAPVLTYDIYSVSGHGFSGMFRPYRSDIGSVHDRAETITSDGTNVSFDASVGMLFQTGFSLNFPNTDSKSGKWKGISGNIHERYSFTQESANSLNEPYRFQVYGEKIVQDKNEVSDLIGGFNPSYIGISGATEEVDYNTTQYLYNKNKQQQKILNNHLDDRMPRQTDIKAIENRYLYDGTLLPECKAYFINNSDQMDTLERISGNGLHLEHHVGAFVVTTGDGTRYIYALPVYNKKQVECSFSTYFGNKEGFIVDKNSSDTIPNNYFHDNGSFVEHNSVGDKNYGYENFDRTEIPAYVHTWLLTAIIGPDYVDMNEDGITDDDLGYFVKFIYKKTYDYKWRAPYNTANFIEGQYALGADNMGTYNYGERETYYLYRAETKSHQAEFYTSLREDAKGASTEFQKSDSAKGASTYKLDSIQLYSKLEMSKPIKSIYFKFNQYDLGDTSRFWVDKNNDSLELCQGVVNATEGRGKLTLKAVYTTYGDNEKGLNNPYVFDYHENDTTENPNYHPFKYDRWGNYQQYWEDPSMNPIKYFPYTRQDVRDGLDVATKNKWASVWNLKNIILPSGAKIAIDYEADRYAYVQNKPAMEMYPIESINNETKETPYTASVGDFLSNSNYVTFKLKREIPSGTVADTIKKELARYIDQTKQLYYKIFVDLNNDNQWEFLTGYADIDSIELVNPTTAKIRFKNIDLTKGKNPQRDEHPFALASWNYVQTSRQELMNDNAKGPLEERARTDKEVLKILMTALSAIQPFSALAKFKNFYNRAEDNDWGLKIDYDKSFIRLNSHVSLLEENTVEKFGGDSRVRSVLIYENKASTEVISGQYYDYTDSIAGTGTKISTGVAQNEPTIGGDESALKYGKIGFMEPKFKTSYLQFQEMPLNESYMPAPDVGYSKVTVRSYATEKVLKEEWSNNIPTTGISINEFYTAKDFPTIFKETELSQNEGSLKYAQPKLAFRLLGGTKTESNFAASQGYYTEINDMHGKEKKVSYYGINHSNKIMPTPISYVEYIYKSDPSTDAFSNPVQRLNNEIPTIKNHLGEIQNKLAGVDVENFIDTRQSHSYTYSDGGRHNAALLVFGFVPIPLYTFFPDNSSDQRRSYTCVNNKIVHRFGILEKTKVYKEGALTVTDNLVFDGYTGAPVLTSVNNEFNDTIYNYTIPAHLIYGDMEPSYFTNNLLFTGTIKNYDTEIEQISIALPQFESLGKFVKVGDEILIKDDYVNPNPDPELDPEGEVLERCYVMQVDEESKQIWIQGRDGYAPGLSGNATAYIYRPSNRNQLNGTVGTIVSRHNPLTTASKQNKCD